MNNLGRISSSNIGEDDDESEEQELMLNQDIIIEPFANSNSESSLQTNGTL